MSDVGKYDDIINLSHPTSKKHPRMPIRDRAAQFAPFAALVGYDDAVEETARVTDEMVEQSEEMKAVIDEKLRYLSERIGEMPTILVTYFLPDEKKSGGEYKIFEGRIKRLDDYDAMMIFECGKKILYDKIYSVEIKEK
ncbi:MAG: hypothetical protein IKA62_03490 [Clostridia bacterium]|nr:hypothetical protein [Clostridia bacterium]